MSLMVRMPILPRQTFSTNGYIIFYIPSSMKFQDFRLTFFSLQILIDFDLNALILIFYSSKDNLDVNFLCLKQSESSLYCLKHLILDARSIVRLVEDVKR